MKTQAWHEYYPKGVPHEAKLDEFNSLPEFIDSCCRKYKDLTAFIHMGVSLSYSEIDRLSAQFAAYLQQKTNLKKGDRIAIQMPNTIQYPVAMFGALRAGLIVVNTNPLYTPREMEHQFNDSGAKAIVILANFAHLLEKVLPNTKIETVIVTELGDMMPFPKRLIVNAVVKYVKKLIPAYSLPKAISFRDVLSGGAGLTLQKVNITSDEVAFLQYTGGTTGVSKGAMLTHRNILSNLAQMKAWMSMVLKEREELIVTALPLYHIFSLTVNCFTFFMYGAQNLLITNPRDMKAFIGEMAKYKFTVITGVNTLYNGLLNQPDFAKLDFSGLKVTVGGGMAVQSIVADKWKATTGVALCEGYGLTESSPVLSCNPLDGRDKIGTIGLPLPSTELKIVDDEGNDLPEGERGEIWGKGPQVMAGYWQRPDETDKVIEKGWLKTGDIGILEKGFFRIVDRKKDMILVSGFNVYPNEVEDVIARHPKVLEVAAIGVPDDKSTEAVKIFIVKKDESLTKEEIKEYCRENMTAYKQPKYIEFKTELPKSNVGKIIRRLLKEPAEAETAKS